MIELIRVELYKVAHRGYSWALFAIAGGVFTLLLWALVPVFIKSVVQADPTGRELFLVLLNFAYSQVPDASSMHPIFYLQNEVLRRIIDGVVIVFIIMTLDTEYRGTLRTLLGHGLNRSRYLAAKGGALLVSLVYGWSAIGVVTFLLGMVFTFGMDSRSVWQASHGIDLLRMIAGNALRHFSVGCFIYFTVVLFRNPLLGIAGGAVYLFLIEPLGPWLLDKVKLPQLTCYTPLQAGITLLDPTFPVTGWDLGRAVLVLLLSGAVSLTGAIVVFRRQELA